MILWQKTKRQLADYDIWVKFDKHTENLWKMKMLKFKAKLTEIGNYVSGH